ncbi:MAG: nitroreductase family protein [Armatimonadota bacterium]
MTIEEAIRHRRSIRRFLPDAVPVTQLREILSLASMAPSIGNRQMWRYILVTEESLRRMLGTLIERRLDDMAQWPEFSNEGQRLRAIRENALHFVNAPVVIFVINLGYRPPLDQMLVARGQKTWETDRQFANPDIQSISGMIAYLTLVAEDRGYGTCWLTDPLVAKKDLQLALELKVGEELVAVVSLGKPAEQPAPKPRKQIDAMIDWR